MAVQDQTNPYDEDLDQPIASPRDRDDSGEEKDSEDYGESFLAPKSAFAGKNLEVGAIHRVKIESIQDSEVVLKCIKSEDSTPEPESEPETESVYE